MDGYFVLCLEVKKKHDKNKNNIIKQTNRSTTRKKKQMNILFYHVIDIYIYISMIYYFILNKNSFFYVCICI
jgi:hypothetical protein